MQIGECVHIRESSQQSTRLEDSYHAVDFYDSFPEMQNLPPPSNSQMGTSQVRGRRVNWLILDDVTALNYKPLEERLKHHYTQKIGVGP